MSASEYVRISFTNQGVRDGIRITSDSQTHTSKDFEALARIVEASSLRQIEALRNEALTSAVDIALDLGGNPTSHGYSWQEFPAGRRFTTPEVLKICIPENSSSRPFPFQAEGISWLVQHPRALLADDMGLGKTFQAAAAAVQLIREAKVSRVLIICPRTLLANWASELVKFFPALTFNVLLPKGRDARGVWKERAGETNVILTSYEQLRTHHQVMTKHSDLVIADEAHKLRNSSSALFKAFCNVARDRAWLLSGTPVERDAEDLATLMTILEPSRFSVSDSHMPLPRLRSRSATLILRRSKGEVLDQLPDVVYRDEWLALVDDQLRRYREAEKIGAREVLKRFNELKTVTDFDPTAQGGVKIDRALEILKAISSTEEKSIVFSFWKGPLEIAARRAAVDLRLDVQRVTGDMSLPERESAVQEFRRRGQVLFLSGHIGSEGLNLIEANHALFLNLWWNPSKNRQAEDRIRRIGQTRTTFIYRFFATGTIDEQLYELLKSKALTEEELVQRLEQLWS